MPTVLSNDTWLTRIKNLIASTHQTYVPMKDESGLMNYKTNNPAVCKNEIAAYNTGGVFVNKLDLTDLLGGVPINLIGILGTAGTNALTPEQCFTKALAVIGITDLDIADCTYGIKGTSLYFNILDSCVHYKGEFEVIYAG